MTTIISPVPGLSQVDLLPIYFLVASLTLIIWDILNHLKDDYNMLFKHRVSYPTVIYFVSRITTFGYSLGKMIILTAPVHPAQCLKFSNANGIIFIIAMSSTTLLFYLRVCAVYNQNIYVRLFFGTTWLGCLGGAATGVTGVVGIPLSRSPDSTRTLCIDQIRHLYIMSSTVILMVNDTLAFAAITYKLGLSNYRDQDMSKKTLLRLFFGESLPAFSKALLQDSQVYFLMALSATATFLITFFTIDASSPTSPFRLIFLVPTLVLVNIMACRIFRNTKLGRAGMTPPTTVVSTAFEMHHPTLPQSLESQIQSAGDRRRSGSLRLGMAEGDDDARKKIVRIGGEDDPPTPTMRSYGMV
ncbi:hypothetical protein B0H34DRAFT_529566 [Crassisporium funariophilum]|nr:hypothetical protein B0H34DRAFT_529566 [Crassisporium funariophilum]